MKRFAQLVWILAVACTAAWAQETAREIIEKADAVRTTTSEIMTMKMDVYDRMDAATPDSSVVLESTGNSDGDSIIVFTYPRSVNGLTILSKDEGQWVYFPSTGRVRKVSGAAKSGSVQGVGGDFSYEDLGTGDWGEDYAFTLVETLESGWVLEGTPEKEDISYTKIRIMIAREDYLPRWIEYYRNGPQPVKKLLIHETKVWDGVAMPALMEMQNLEKKSRTVLTISDAKVNTPVDDGKFTAARFYR
ncbi:MAG: outer membrane lipoprotein-sorting protein [Spirochaetales bacterium]|nr:outer membrane lipoprotein-sorting protein [Spirochaetales bacterium]